MGHDIFAYRNKDESVEVAYLRRGAFNELNTAIYAALGAEEHYCGCSGCNTGAFFTKTQIAAALERLPSGDDYGPERTFLARCVVWPDGVWIRFA